MAAKIYPQPMQIKEEKGRMNFGRNINCYISADFKGKHSFSILGELWNNFTMGAGDLTVCETSALKENQIVIGHHADGPFIELQTDYSVKIDEQGVHIEGKDKKNTIWGFMTVLQCIQPIELNEGMERFTLPYLEIQDKPKVPFRSIHLCVFPETSLHFLRKAVRFAAMMKYTHIVLEFWGMLKFDVMKELSWENAFTKEEIRPIIEDARAMGAQIIPMFNHLGHAAQSRVSCGRHVVLDQNPRKACLFEPDGWTWCISKPEVRALLKSIREELMELCGEGAYFHLGCDEAYSFGECDLCSEQDRNVLLTEFINEVAQDLKENGRRAIIWGDEFLDQSVWGEPGKPYFANSTPETKTHEFLDHLDKSIIIADWQYEIKEGRVLTSEYFMQKGRDTILCPWEDVSNIETLGKEAANIGAFGFMATTWHTLPLYTWFICYPAEIVWSGKTISRIEVEALRSKCVGLMRKVLPSGGSFEKAGWRSVENELQ